MGDLTGKVALITGVEDGVGQEIAIQLARECLAIGMAFIADSSYANKTLAEIDLQGGRAISIQCDLSNPESVTYLFDEILSRLGSLDLVVIHFAIAADATVPEATPEEFGRLIGNASEGAQLIFQEAARRLPEGARIVQCASMKIHRTDETHGV